MTLNAITGGRDRVSVAMATYNGAAFLREQIESLFHQTRQPDELIVHDDASTDGTVSLLRRMAAQAPFKMRILEDERNHGVNAAFQSALEQCSGDTVFFCDQDDIWLPRKIERCMAALDDAPQAGFVFCDASQFDSINGILDRSLWEHTQFVPRRQAAFLRDPLGTLLTGGNFVYGMASGFRRGFLAPFIPIDCDAAGMTHDTWFAMHAAAMGASGVPLPERLVRYRRHDRQTSAVLGGRSASGPVRLHKAQARSAALIAALRSVRGNIKRHACLTDRDISPALTRLDRKIAFLETRERLRRDRGAGAALRGIVNPDYWRLASGPASVLRDYRGIW